ncbi:MAG: class I SAM-dependent methyltransferase [Candidatus Omnitrophica bacterium]|nr:class I SAM-dependent methyltransferase [Candidatus Omnitrophota bacterium]
MRKIDFEKATADELWDWCLLEYQSRNPITQHLINYYYAGLAGMLNRLKSDDRVLEVGCGAAESTRRISSLLKSQHFEASEYDTRFVQKLKETKFPIKVIQESVYELQRQDRSYDCVILLEVLEHLDDYHKALSELFRVSRRDVIVAVPNEPLWRVLNVMRGRYVSDGGNTPGHINHWSPTQFRMLIEEFGTIKSVVKPLPWVMVLARTKDSVDDV